MIRRAAEVKHSSGAVVTNPAQINKTFIVVLLLAKLLVGESVHNQ